MLHFPLRAIIIVDDLQAFQGDLQRISDIEEVIIKSLSRVSLKVGTSSTLSQLEALPSVKTIIPYSGVSIEDKVIDSILSQPSVLH